MAKAHTLQERWLKEDERQIDSAVDALLKAPNGRQFLWWLLEVAGVGRQPFNGDPHITAFACGELNVGQKILERIMLVQPAGYVSMMQEKADERRRRDDELRGADPGRRDPIEPDQFGEAARGAEDS